ncbi:MAG: hypothetical protein IKN63_05785 [Bacilli bacterium]|nr:hypothetical protein [Bacilli bacterium]
MSDIRYLVVKEKNKKTVSYFEYDKLDGYGMIPKNKNIKLRDAINVNKMVIINPSFIEKLINKKINSKIKKLIDLISTIYENDDDDPAGSLMQALNEVEKFKREMINKYLNYMSKEQVDLLEKKINILETEVMNHAYKLNEQQFSKYENSMEYEDYEPKRSR